MGGWVCVRMGKGKGGWIEFLHNGYYPADFFSGAVGCFWQDLGAELSE